MTGRISFLAPEYSPISSAVSVVRRSSSSRHCRAATVLVTRISVVAWASAIASAPTIVLPEPQGSTTTPEPPCQKPSAASVWYGRGCQQVGLQADGVPLAVDVAGDVLRRPAELDEGLLQVAALAGVDDDRRASMRAPSSGETFLLRSTSSSTDCSIACRTSPCTGWLLTCSRP